MVSKQFIYIVQRRDFEDEVDQKGALEVIEAHASVESANAAAKAHLAKARVQALHKYPEIKESESKDGGYNAQCWTLKDDRDSFKVEVKKMELIPANENRASNAAKAKATSTAEAKKKAANLEEDDEEVEKDQPAPAKKALTKKTQIMKGSPNALEGLKVLFTGTFETMDRKTSNATAEKYGATIVKKLEETDYVIMGVKAGQKKIEEINEKGLDSIDEEGFLELLRNGVPQEKRERMRAWEEEKQELEPPAKKQKRKK